MKVYIQIQRRSKPLNQRDRTSVSHLVGLPSLFDQVCCDDPVDNTGYPTRDLRMAGNSFVLRTDVKSYYASIDHVRLLEQLAEFIKERAVLQLLWQYLRRTVTWDGLYREHTRRISRGCPLSSCVAR